jgi:hypothetical protein
MNTLLNTHLTDIYTDRKGVRYSVGHNSRQVELGTESLKKTEDITYVNQRSRMRLEGTR